jgi:MFS transporter, DHA2 family, multidrug resistance protein
VTDLSAPKIYPQGLTKYLIVVSVMLVTFMELLDMTIVNVALPPMMGQLGADSDQITWVLTSYIVSSAIVMPLTGFLVDTFGRRRLLLIAIAGFLVSSMMCGLSVTLDEILFFRVLQGVFGAVLVPLSQYILRDSFPKEEQGMAMAFWGVGVMVAPVLGPTLGGYITENLTWRWVFYINVPVCIVAFFLTMQVIKETPRKMPKLDIIGLLLMIGGVGCLQVFLDRGNSVGWFTSKFIQVMVLITVICLTTFLIRGIRKRDNIINLKLFLNRNFSLSTLLFTLFSIGIISTISVQPLLLENLLGYTAESAGLVMAPRGIAAAVSMFIAGMISNRFDPRWILCAGILISGLGTYYMSDINTQTSFAVIALQGAVQGFGMGFFFVPIAALALSTLSEKDMAEGSGLFSFGRNVGCSIGISLISTIITQETQINWNQLGGHLQASSYNLQRYMQIKHLVANQPESIKQLAGTLLKQASMISFIDAFWIVAVSFVFILPLVYFLQKPKGPLNISAH